MTYICVWYGFFLHCIFIRSGLCRYHIWSQTLREECFIIVSIYTIHCTDIYHMFLHLLHASAPCGHLQVQWVSQSPISFSVTLPTLASIDTLGVCYMCGFCVMPYVLKCIKYWIFKILKVLILGMLKLGLKLRLILDWC
jgi:hypothetical protein